MRKSGPFEQLAALKLGVSDTELELESSADCVYATELMLAQATSSIEIFSRELDPSLYDRDAFLATVAERCTRQRGLRLRILVHDPATAVKRGHRLIELGRKLSSCIEIRQPHSDYRQYNQAFLVADECGLIHRDFADRFEGRANFYDFVSAKRLSTYFNEVWDRSEPNPETRRLHL